MRVVLCALQLFFFAVLIVPGHLAIAADANGYTAKYECRAGGPYCDVDVATLGQRTCDEIVDASIPWSEVEWSSDTICITPGDHTWKGVLRIPGQFSGTSGHYKVLRYHRPGDSNDDPWDQPVSSRARLAKLEIDGAHHLLVHRLTFPLLNRTWESDRVFFQNGAHDTILNRLLIEGAPPGSMYYSAVGSWGSGCAGTRQRIQNSVIRNNGPAIAEGPAIAFECGSDIYVVNNEIYDWAANGMQFGTNHGPTMPGIVVENNDIYWTDRLYSDGGRKIAAQVTVTFKSSGTASNPIRILHNRIWGNRFSDSDICCGDGGGNGKAISITPPLDSGHGYFVIKNNVIYDNQVGIEGSVGSNHHISVVGNLIYKTRQYYSGWSSSAIEMWTFSDSEIYLNTIVDADVALGTPNGKGDNDIKCNVFVDATEQVGSHTDGSTHIEANAFYNAVAYGEDRLARAPRTRASSTTYQAGQIVRLSDNGDTCSGAEDSACFLYMVVRGGTTAASRPGYCTSLGCKTTDGTAVLQAIRGPYTFYRKLQTGAESYSIPHARVHVEAPEAYSCPESYASRDGIGVSDD